MPHIGKVDAVTYQTAGRDELTKEIASGYSMARRESHNLIALAHEEHVRGDKQRVGSLLDKRRKGRFDFAFGSRVHDPDLSPDSLRCRLHISDEGLGIREVGFKSTPTLAALGNKSNRKESDGDKQT
jgi:hypothetical protein